MLLLTDGSVMALSGDDHQTWFKLAPDAQGSYVNGTWSVLAAMNIPRLYFTSDVLQDGRVWVLGGEYTGPYLDYNDAPTGEIYDPINNTWTAVTSYPKMPSCSANSNEYQVTSNVTLTSGSPAVTGIYSTDRFQIGWTLIGTSALATALVGARVVSVDSPTQVTLDTASSMTGPATLRFVGPVAACFGDDPSALLPGGNILAGDVLTNQPNIYSIANDSWSPAGVKFYNDQSDEEGWAILDDNRVINYDLFQSVGLDTLNRTGQGYAEIYDPSTNAWTPISPVDGTANGTLPVLSSVQMAYELGPVIRLQDGRVLEIGGNQHTALYTPSTNTWSAGPDTIGTLYSPYGNIENANFGADEAPAAELPNGHVILATDAGPNPITKTGLTLAGSPKVNVASTAGVQLYWNVAQTDGMHTAIPAGAFVYSINSATQISLGQYDATGNLVPVNALASTNVSLVFGGLYNNPTQLFDFDPVGNTMTPIASPSPKLAYGSAYVTRMLMLPTGQLLLNDSSNQLYAYTPDGGPSMSVRPVVNGLTYSGAGVFTLTGKQLNGQSAGASYGDDAQMNENYPIVRLQDGFGHVFYCRTTNWSSVAVGGGATPQTVNFTLNPNVTSGYYLLTVTGAGITSMPVVIRITAAELAGL
jgi:hypothetical protein